MPAKKKLRNLYRQTIGNDGTQSQVLWG